MFETKSFLWQSFFRKNKQKYNKLMETEELSVEEIYKKDRLKVG